MRSTITSVWSLINRFLEWFSDLGLFAWQVMRAAVRRPFEGRELLRQLDEIGSKSLPLVALAGAAIGAVLSLESRSSLVRFGAKSMLPAALVYSIIHETGPFVTGLVVSGRVGAGIGAELGSMKVTEQIDAIEASGVNPRAVARASLDNQDRFSKRRFVAINVRCSGQLVTTGVSRFRSPITQREHSAFRGQVGKMIGFIPDRGTPNSLSRAGRNVLLDDSGRTGWRHGLRAGAAGSSSAAARCAFHGGSYEECGRAVR